MASLATASGSPAFLDALGAERVPDHGHVDLLALEGLEIVPPAPHDVDDAELAVLEPVFLNRRRELEPRDGAGPHPDRLGPETHPLLDVLTLADEQAVVAGADARHPDHRLGALTQAERDVLRPEGGNVEIT